MKMQSNPPVQTADYHIQRIFDELGIDNEVTIELENNKIIIKPVKENTDDFSEEILSDLIDEGYDWERIDDRVQKT